MSLTSGATSNTLSEIAANVYSKLKIINASQVTTSGALNIAGNKRANTIVATANGSTLSGGKGNDILVGGDGADIFVYTKGRDAVQNYGTGDVISLSGSMNFEEFSISKGNVLFTSGSKRITVTDAADKEITLRRGDDTNIFVDGTLYTSDKSSATLSSNFSTTYSSKNTTTIKDAKTIDVTFSEKAVNIAGNTLDNSILGGSKNDTLYGDAGADTISGGKGKDIIYGGAGNDSLWGGKGNDTLYGDDGNDTFIYNRGDGKDIIYGFDDADIIQINSNFKASYNTRKNEISLKVGSGNITLREYTASEFNISVKGKAQTYIISDGSFVKK